MNEISKQRSFPISLDSYLLYYTEITCSFQVLVEHSKIQDNNPGRSQVQSLPLPAGRGEVLELVLEEQNLGDGRKSKKLYNPTSPSYR